MIYNNHVHNNKNPSASMPWSGQRPPKKQNDAAAALRINSTQLIGLRFHKVGSTSVEQLLAKYFVRASFEHSTLQYYRNGGLDQVRCSMAPDVNRAAFFILFREPGARLLSSLGYYAAILSRFFSKSEAETVQSLMDCPCANYTATQVKLVFEIVQQCGRRMLSEEFGGGLMLSEYSHYLGSDTDAVLDVLRRDFVVGVTEDIPALVSKLTHFVEPASERPIVLPRLMRSMRKLNQQRVSGFEGQQTSGRFCSMRELTPATAAQVSALCGPDAALYDGARRLAREQQAIDQGPAAAAPVKEFGQACAAHSAARLLVQRLGGVLLLAFMLYQCCRVRRLWSHQPKSRRTA